MTGGKCSLGHRRHAYLHPADCPAQQLHERRHAAEYLEHSHYAQGRCIKALAQLARVDADIQLAGLGEGLHASLRLHRCRRRTASAAGR